MSTMQLSPNRSSLLFGTDDASMSVSYIISGKCLVIMILSRKIVGDGITHIHWHLSERLCDLRWMAAVFVLSIKTSKLGSQTIYYDKDAGSKVTSLSICILSGRCIHKISYLSFCCLTPSPANTSLSPSLQDPRALSRPFVPMEPCSGL